MIRLVLPPCSEPLSHFRIRDGSETYSRVEIIQQTPPIRALNGDRVRYDADIYLLGWRKIFVFATLDADVRRYSILSQHHQDLR